MNWLIRSKFYAVLITITDYILLGVLWVITSLPLVTVGVTSAAMFSTLHQWDRSSTGSIVKHYINGMKHHLLAHLLNGIVYVAVLGTISFLVQNTHLMIPVAIGLCLAFIMSTMLFINVTQALMGLENEKINLGQLIEGAVQTIFIRLFPNLLTVCLIYLSYVIVSLFPPLLFLFAGGIWQLIYRINRVKEH